MNELNIYALLMAIRGFSNEITVRGLSDKLGISYSTLARCKNGKWPRSVTLEAMRDVLEECRMRFFDGDGEALAKAVFLHFDQEGVPSEGLKATLENDGYEAFLSALLVQAHSGVSSPTLPEPDSRTGKARVGESKTDDSQRVELQADKSSQAEDVLKGEDVDAPLANDASVSERRQSAVPAVRTSELVLMVPLAVVLLIGILGFSLSSFIVWAAQNTSAFVVVSLVIALVPAFAGVFVDSAFAWREWKAEHADARFSWKDYAHVAKYGSTDGMRPGKGRYDLSRSYLLYQPVCNVLGMLCYVTLLGVLLALPEYLQFLQQHEWTEFFKAGIAVGFFVALTHTRDQLTRPYVVNQTDDGWGENPDTQLLTRFHVWANIVHLVWSISLVIVLLLSLLAYGIVRFRSVGMPPAMTLSYLVGMLFLAYANTSPYAVRHHATSVGSFLPGVLAASVGLVGLTLVCFLPSWGGAILCAFCVLCSVGSIAWVRTYATKGQGEWLMERRGSAIFSASIAVSIFVMLALWLLTSAL